MFWPAFQLWGLGAPLSRELGYHSAPLSAWGRSGFSARKVPCLRTWIRQTCALMSSWFSYNIILALQKSSLLVRTAIWALEVEDRSAKIHVLVFACCSLLLHYNHIPWNSLWGNTEWELPRNDLQCWGMWMFPMFSACGVVLAWGGSVRSAWSPSSDRSNAVFSRLYVHGDVSASSML